MLYDYVCEECGHELHDVEQSIKDKPLVKCPKCKKHGLQRVIYGGILAKVKNITTIGQLADENTKRDKNKLNEEAAKKLEDNPPPKKEWWQNNGKTDREINKMSPERKMRWIMEGR